MSEERRGGAGSSAQREYERRSRKERARKEQATADDAAWRQRVRERHPFIGRLVTWCTPKPAMTPESQQTKNWATGAEGERRVGEVLDGVPGVATLHDRRVPGSSANIDHIVVGPGGVFVIDTKKHKGAVEARDVGGLFRTDVQLRVGGRDRTNLVDSVLAQMEVVRTALGPMADVPIHGILCFVAADWGWRLRPKVVKGVTALWPLALPEHVGAPGPLVPAIDDIAELLARTLRPA